MYFEKNNLLTIPSVNEVIFDEKPYEMGIIQILIRESKKRLYFIDES